MSNSHLNPNQKIPNDKNLKRNLQSTILFGFIKEVNRNNLDSYFKREYEKWKNENYSIREFFDYCFLAIKDFEEYKNLSASDKQFLNDNLEKYSFNKNPFSDKYNINQKKSLPENKEHLVNFFKSIEKEKLEQFKALEKIDIRKHLDEIRVGFKEKNTTSTNDLIPLNFNLRQNEVVKLFEILIEAGLIDAPKFQDGSYYKKLETFFTASNKPIKNARKVNNNNISTPDINFQSLRNKLLKTIETIIPKT